MKILKTTIIPIPNSSDGSLSDHIFSRCNFCQKKCKLEPNYFKNLHKLSNFKEFFCCFCIRNGFNTKFNKNVLILSFKNIFNYYYSEKYIGLNKIWLAQIEDLVREHEENGMKNPTFYYDEESMLWFINFLRIGIGRRKIEIEEIYRTINLIVESLKINTIAPEIEENVFKQKYFDAVNLFYTKRYRPNNKKILSPKVGDIKTDFFIDKRLLH